MPNHRIEASTREGYTCALRAHILPFFGHCPLDVIVPTAIKQWQTALKQLGLSASNRRMCKVVLSAVLTAAVEDELIASNPCHRVKTDPVSSRPLRLITPTELEAFLREAGKRRVLFVQGASALSLASRWSR